MSSLDASSPPDDTFKILIATDIHLGYAENDPVRGEDSFNSFEEILELAKANDVDFILLGGDLFHDNKPSTQCLYRCMALLRKYCMGERPISVEFMSDPNVNFQHCYERLVNYEDPNLNISIPVFSIHGNHDDPTGSIQLSSLDILSVSGLVNYFGKWTDLTDVKISPMLLRKGASKLAIYGLSHIKDERLARLFRSNNVQFFQPSESTNEWFNIFVCHQNRVDRGLTKYVQEEALPEIMDLVIWGHEHECKLLDDGWNPTKAFTVIQPGSSVATSLCEGEAKKKHVALLRVHDRRYKIDNIPLKTVRPFIFETIKLSECNIHDVDHNPATNVQRYLTERVDYTIVNASDQITGHPKQPTLPLIRIRVEYNDELQCFNSIRFGQQFQSKVANPTDMIKLCKEKLPREKKAHDGIEGRENMEDFLQNEEVEDLWEVKMNAIIAKYFNEVNTAKPMQVLSIRGISEAASRYIDKGDRDSIERIFNHQRNKMQKYLLDENIPLENLDAAIAKYREDRKQNPVIEAEENKQVFPDDFAVGAASTSNNGGDALQMRISDDSDDGFNNVAPTTTSQRGRGSRGGRGRAAAPKAPSTRGRGGRGSRARGAASATNTLTLTTMVQKTQSQRSTRASTSTGGSTSNKNSKLNRLRYDDSDSD